MGRTRNFIYNSSSSALLQIVTFIVGLITPRVMLQVYGSEVNGLISSITQFISYFNLVEAGLSGATVYSLYKPLAQNDYGKVNSIVAAAKRFYQQAGYIFVTLTFLLAVIYPLYIDVESLFSWEIGILVLILGVNGALEFFTLSKYRALLTADQRTYVISIVSIFQIIVNTSIVCAFAFLNVNIVLTRLVALFSIFLRSVLLMLYCKKKYKYLDYKVEPDVKSLNKRWDALTLQILGVVHTGAPVVLITLVLKDLKIVSVYSVFNMVIAGIGNILSVFTSGTSASFGDVIAKKETAILQKSYKEFEFLYYSVITVVYSITFATIMPFIKIYTSSITDVNYDVPLLGFMFVLNGLLYNLKTPQGMLVISAGHYKETKKQTITQALIAVIGGFLLSLWLGIYGIMLGSIISNLYRDIDLLFYIPHNVTKTSVFSTFRRMVRVFICTVISVAPVFLVSYKPSNLFAWAIYACGFAIWSLIVTLLISLIFDKNELRNVFKRFKIIK